MKNNATNIPYPETPGYLLIGNGTAPVVGPLLGGTGITVMPSGTAIELSSLSSYQNYLSTLTWGEAPSPGFISCGQTTLGSSVYGIFNGKVKKVLTFWQSAPSNQFLISIWGADKSTLVAQTPSFSPGTGLNSSAMTAIYSITSGTVFWAELQPVSSVAGANVYGISGLATNISDFNIQAPLSGGTPIAPNSVSFTSSTNRVWFYFL